MTLSRNIAAVALSLGVLVAACTADTQNSETPTPTAVPTVDPGRPVDFDLICGGIIRHARPPETPTLLILRSSQTADTDFCADEPTGALDEIDFETKYGVVVIRGWFPSGLYAIEVQDVRVSEDTVTVMVALSDPPDFPPPPSVETVPHQLIAVGKAAVDGTSVWQMVTTDGTVLTMTRFPPE